MGHPNQLHGATGAMDNAAVTAVTLADGIEGHRTALQPIVAGLRAGWDGTAPPMFETAHANWEAGITRLCNALRELGDNTQFASTSYVTVDADNANNLAALQSGGAFGGVLQSSV